MAYRFMRFPQGKAKALTLSYDDGCRFDQTLVPILDKYGVKATFNLNSALVEKKDGEWRLSEKEILALFKHSPHEIAVHGARHVAPGIASPVAVIDDVLSCRKWLEAKFDRIVRGMAYPDCGITRIQSDALPYAKLRDTLHSLGIDYARTLGADNDRFLMPDDWYAWTPTAHHINPQLFDYLDRFLTLDANDRYLSDRHPRLFYLWGHSYEFDRSKNWDLIENFCQKVAEKKDEIWFATNGEIYAYTTAYESLIWNAEETLVYNPTLFDLYFSLGGTLYCVKSGETLRLK